MSSLPSDAAAEIDELNLLARLEQKRREIEAEIEAFKAEKEGEYRDLERQLREEQRQSNRRRKRENGGANTGGVKATGATHGAADATSSDGDEGVTRREQVGPNTGAQIPLDLGGSKLNDALRFELPANRKQPGFDGNSVSSSITTSPPFEKELQAAGLFTPRYLPLLDNNYNYFRQSPPISPPLQDPSSSGGQTSPQPLMPKLATIPARTTSPAYPLASSLKSSSGSSTSTPSKSGTMKQKSPKRVTFQFEDENSVPSRSSPPPAKVHWTLEDENYQFEDEDGFVEYEGEELEEVDEDEFDESDGKVEQVENVTAEGSGALVQRFSGDELVVSSTIGENGSGSSSIMQSSEFNGLGIRGMSGGLSTNGMNGNKAGSDSTDDEVNDDEDEEEALFDLDETIPEVLDNSPPHRDYSALLDTQQPQTNDRLTASKFPMLPSFTPSVPPIPVSATDSLLTFGKSPGPRLGLPRVRRGSFSSSLSPILNQKQFDEQEPIASSLPNFGWKGIDPPKSGFVPTPGGRFRRRSIVKYDLPEDDSASLKGKGKETHRAIDEEEDDEDDAMLSLSRSPNATSLPMSISRHSPAAFASNSGSSARSPKPQPQPVNYNDIPDASPVSGRPSPELHSPPLSAAAPVRAAEPYKVDSADILASMPTSSPTAEDGSLEKNDSVSSYRRSSPFPSAYDRTPYRTAYAAEVAAAAALDDEADYGGAMESVVGGVDGRTGLDPDVSSFSYRASSLRVDGGRARRGSLAGASGSVGGVDPGRMSLGMRMAFESAQKEGDGRRGGR